VRYGQEHLEELVRCLWDGVGGSVGDTWCSNGSEKTGIESSKDFKDVLVHIAAVFFVVCGSPWYSSRHLISVRDHTTRITITFTIV